MEPVAAFRASAYAVRFAGAPWERAGAAALRRAVFCGEQGLFGADDRDAVDAVAIPIVALSTIAGDADEVVGTVRIHEAAPGEWWGSRLAVDRAHRRVGALGAALIRVAVCAAHARGARAFHANVQAQNAAMFEALHWETLARADLHGRPHHLMRADLAHYPPMHDPEWGLTALARRAA